MIAMNLCFLRFYMKGCAKPILFNVAKTAAAALLMGGAAWLAFIPCEKLLGVRIGGLVSISFAGIVYAALLFVFRAVTLNELKNIKRGG